MARQEPLKVITKVVRGDEVIPYDSLSKEEKTDLAKKLNQRAIAAVEKAHGRTVEFVEMPKETKGTA